MAFGGGAPYPGAMHSRPPATPESPLGAAAPHNVPASASLWPSDPTASPDDLQLLLAALRFRHWRGCIVTLLDRYDGWAAGRSGGRLLGPDFSPLADVLTVLDDFPSHLAGQDRALARALLACPLLVRAAQDARTAEPWEPLEQSYREFASRRAVRQLVLPDIPWPERDFEDWTLEQLGSQPRGWHATG